MFATFQLELVSYLYYVTSEDISCAIQDDEILYFETTEDFYTLLDLKHILLN